MVDNIVMKDYYEDFTNANKTRKAKSDRFYHQWDSLKEVYNGNIPASTEVALRKTQNDLYKESDSLLMRYIESHPDSYLGLWKLVQIASFSGYEPLFDTAFENLSPALKSTHTGR